MQFAKSVLPVSSPRLLSSWLPAVLFVTLFSSLSYAAAPDRITGTVSSAQTVTLRGNVHHKALPQFDQGAADPAMQLGTMTILTLPTVSQRKALLKLVADQENPSSPNYRKWLTAQQWADLFGLSQHDVQQIAGWLKSQGFTAIRTANGRNWVSFNGTAAQVESAFGTEIHRYAVNGELHYANATAPSVPAALGSVVTSIRGLHDFRPRPTSVHRALPNYYSSALQAEYVAPGDVATIYDISALGSAIDGTGQKLAVMGQTDVYLADITDFRTGFGLSAINCTTNPTTGVITACNDPHFQYMLEGADPGVLTGDNLEEADLDLEWSGAIAPGATIVFVNSTDVFTSFYDAIDDVGTLGESVISLSYGICEFGDNNILDPSTGLPGADETEFLKANAEGITFINSSGDSGAAACDPDSPYTNNDPNGASATGGLAVSYPASSPEVTAVGGTAIPLANLSLTYWGTSNGTTGGSVLPNGPQQGYIPEQAWNDDAEIAQLCEGVTSSDPNYLFCTQGGSKKVAGWVPITSAQTAQSDFAITNTGISAGGGGVSNCARQNSAFTACVSGFPKPSWQTVTVTTSPQASGRLAPDVSLLATPNFPGYIFCTPLSELGGTGTASSCAGGIATAVSDGSLVGGTSVAAPVFAGIVALLNQYLGSAGLGNINPTLYTLAATPANGAFHPVTTSNNLVYCTAGTPVSVPAQPSTLLCPNTGVLGFEASDADATTGYNPVTGLGSVDVNKLFTAWAASTARTASAVMLASSATGTVNVGTSVTFTATVTPSRGTGAVSFSTLNGGVTTVLGTALLNVPYPPSTTGTASFSTTALPGGTNSVTATYEGDGSDKPSTSAAVMVNVIAPDFTLSVASPASATVVAGNTTSPDTITITPENGYSPPAGTTLSCTAGLPTGATCTFTPNPVPSNGTQPVQTVLTIGTFSSTAATTSPATITISATGSAVTKTANFSLTVTPTNQSFTLAPQPASYSVSPGQTANASIILTASNGFSTPVTYTCGTGAGDGVPESMCTGPTGPTNKATISFAVTTTAPTSSRSQPLGRGMRIFYAALLPGVLGILFTGGARGRSLLGMRWRGIRFLGMVCLLGFSTLWLGSCSGSGGGIKNAGTPAGSYSVPISATTGGANPQTATTMFTVVVN